MKSQLSLYCIAFIDLVEFLSLMRLLFSFIFQRLRAIELLLFLNFQLCDYAIIIEVSINNCLEYFKKMLEALILPVIYLKKGT